jgi:hypothetical protein
VRRGAPGIKAANRAIDLRCNCKCSVTTSRRLAVGDINARLFILRSSDGDAPSGMSNRDGQGLDNRITETLTRRGLTGVPLLHDQDHCAVGAKADVVRGPRQLRVFTLGLCEDARWNDTGTDQIIAHRH